MGNRGSKLVILYNITVKEQRADGSSVFTVRCALVAGKAGSKVKRSNRILSINLLYWYAVLWI